MAMPINDGTLQIGTRSLTISAKAYVCQSFNVTSDSWDVTRMDANGVLDGRYIGTGETKGTATLLFSATVGYDTPALGDTFSATIDGVSMDFYVTEVGATEGQRDMKTCSISFTKKLN